MGSRKMIIYIKSVLVSIALLVYSSVAVSGDWAYELTDNAKNIYIDKKVASCELISELLGKRDHRELYTLIRDSALFKIRACENYIQKNLPVLKKIEGVSDAVSFYYYQMGDKAKLNDLANSFDKNIKEVPDHWTVELFGFIDEWEITGRRLVRYSKDSDGVGSELVCSALKWRRFLYGEVYFQKNWRKYSEIEHLNIKKQLEKLQDCLP